MHERERGVSQDHKSERGREGGGRGGGFHWRRVPLAPLAGVRSVAGGPICQSRSLRLSISLAPSVCAPSAKREGTIRRLRRIRGSGRIWPGKEGAWGLQVAVTGTRAFSRKKVFLSFFFPLFILFLRSARLCRPNRRQCQLGDLQRTSRIVVRTRRVCARELRVVNATLCRACR